MPVLGYIDKISFPLLEKVINLVRCINQGYVNFHVSDHIGRVEIRVHE